MSLRKYLLISILLIITLITGVTVWSSYSESTREVKELFDAQLARSARLMLGLTLIEIRDGRLQELQSMILRNRLRLDEHKYEDVEMVLTKEPIYEMKLAFQVWDNQGNMILRSGNAPLYPLTQQASGYSEQIIDTTHWRIFSLWNDDYSYQVMAAEHSDVRDELIDSITWRLLLPFLIMFPVLAGLVWLAIGWGLKPLSRVAGEVKNRNIRNLDALDVESVPEEVKPLVLELNWLFATLKESFDKERRFTSDAAHELRTPLAALKTHAQLATMTDSCEDQKKSINKIMAGVDRASHVVNQLLVLARLEQGHQQSIDMQPVDLTQLSQEMVSELHSLVSQRNIELSVEAADPQIVSGELTMLSMLLRNLLDNAIRYSPEGSRVELGFGQSKQGISLFVSDNGPGIADEEKDKVFSRFHRGEALEETGCGIGLSIVRQVAELHRAQIKLSDNPGGGLRVEVRFPM